MAFTKFQSKMTRCWKQFTLQDLQVSYVYAFKGGQGLIKEWFGEKCMVKIHHS